MHLAARCGSAEAMDWLYQHGGKPRAKTEVGGATHLLLPLCPLCRSRRNVLWRHRWVEVSCTMQQSMAVCVS